MRSFSLLLAIFLGSAGMLDAQSPPPPNPPFTLPFPFKASSFMGLRSEAPFRGVVTAKTVTDNSFTVTIKRGELQTNTYHEIGTSADAIKLVKYFVVGREYAFPAIFDKVLGPPKATPVLPFPVPPIESQPLRLVDLRKTKPFRAKVVSKEAKPEHVTLELERTGGGHETLTQSGNVGMEEAHRIAGLLEIGETYEFPDAVLPSATKEKMPAAEPSTTMKELVGFIGEWERPAAEQPKGRYVITYTWKEDGAGMWKEVTMERPDVLQTLKSEWLITFDPERKCYVERGTNRGIAPEITFTWNAETRVSSLRGEQHHAKHGPVTYSGQRTFTTPDRIEWKSQSKDKEGKVVEESSGAYLRAKR